MFDAIVQGLTMGLILSTVIGPISFMLIDLGINSSLKSVFYLSLATFISDLTTILFLQFAACEFIKKYEDTDILYITGGSILIYLGLVSVLKKPKKENFTNLSEVNLISLFVKGFLVNFLNPMIFFFWFGAVIAAVSAYENNTRLIITHFLGGLIIVLSCDFLKGYAAYNLKRFLTPTILKSIGKFSGIIIIGYGIKLIFLH